MRELIIDNFAGGGGASTGMTGTANPRGPLWTEADKARLGEAISRGMTVGEAAVHCGRSKDAVENARHRLKLPRFRKRPSFVAAHGDDALAMRRKGWSYERIARKFGVTRWAVFKALKSERREWRSVDAWVEAAP